MAGVTAVILGGGRGSRLFPLTKDRAKPGVPIAGKFRLIDIPMSNCIHSGLERIFILTQFNSASLNHHVTETYQFGSMSARSVRILAAQQTSTSDAWFLGTADAVRQTLSHIVTPRERPDHILVLSGDHLYRMDYRAMIQEHLAHGADITVSVTPVSRSEAPRFGILKVDGDGRLTRFIEKPQSDAQLAGLEVELPAPGGGAPRRAFLGSMGIYLFRTDVLAAGLQDTSNVDFGRDIFPGSIGASSVYAHVFDGYWADIGTIRSFFDANLSLLDRVPRFDFYNEEAPVYTTRYHLPNTKINGSRIRESMLAEGSIIDESSISRSIVGLRCFVRQDTVIESALLMGADYYESAEQIAANLQRGIPPMGVGRRCTLVNAIVDKNAHIGDDVQLTNRQGLAEADGDGWYIREGVIVVPKDGVIPSGTVI